MSFRSRVTLLGLCVLSTGSFGGSVWAQDAYPRVMSPTGRFYGPTQAHYQYERQYGRPWHGGPAPFDPNTGANINIQVPNYQGVGIGFGGYYGYGGNVPYGGYGYGYGYQRNGFPLLGYGPAAFNGYSGYNGYYQEQTGFGPIQQYYGGPQFQYSWQGQYQQLPSGEFPREPLPPPPGGRGFGTLPQRGVVAAPVPRGNVLNVQPVGPEIPVVNRARQLLPPQPSTLEQKARSVHSQGQGDIWFRQQNFLQAYSRYKQAATAASDLAAPRFRMAYALIALKRYELAVTEMARGIQLDPKYPLSGESPEQVFGPENQIAAGALAGQVADWVRQDMRAPDRLFLLGALLRMNGDLERSKICFEAAAQLGGQPAPVMAFLKVDQPANVSNTGRPQIADDDRPPVPEAVEELLKNNNQWVPGTSRPVAANRKPMEARPLGPKLIGPPALPPGQLNKRESAPLETPPVIEAQPEAEPENPEPSQPSGPELGTEAVDPPKAKSTTPGFQPIPKKGSSKQPESSGPFIPNPASGN